MPRPRQNHCYAPGCQTGYVFVKGAPKISLFGVPKDEARRKLWERNLHRADTPLDDTSAVCELHFEPRYVSRDYVHIIQGQEVRIPRGKPTLSADAVPTILPNLPTYLTKKLPRKSVSLEKENVQKPAMNSAAAAVDVVCLILWTTQVREIKVLAVIPVSLAQVHRPLLSTC